MFLTILNNLSARCPRRLLIKGCRLSLDIDKNLGFCIYSELYSFNVLHDEKPNIPKTTFIKSIHITNCCKICFIFITYFSDISSTLNK